MGNEVEIDRVRDDDADAIVAACAGHMADFLRCAVRVEETIHGIPRLDLLYDLKDLIRNLGLRYVRLLDLLHVQAQGLDLEVATDTADIIQERTARTIALIDARINTLLQAVENDVVMDMDVDHMNVDE
jgi:hypothetical protein